MPIKCVMVLQQVTEAGASIPSLRLAGREHIGSWTEHVWYPADNVDDCMRALTMVAAGNGLLPARAGFLNRNATVLGVRLYQGGAGRGQFRPAAFPGQARKADVPQLAALCSIGFQDSVKTRSFTCRGLADDDVKGGELAPDAATQTALETFGEVLGARFGAYAYPVVVDYPIFNIGGAGLVTLRDVAPALNAGDIVEVQNTLDANGIRRKLFGMVAQVGPLDPQFTIADWPYGACTGGIMRLPRTKTLQRFDVTTFAVSRAVVRKVGRPFEPYRGRRSRRQRT